MDLDLTQAICHSEEENEQSEEEKIKPVKKEVANLKVFSQQGFKERIFPIYQGDNYIGRDAKCNDVTIPIKALSKKHACVEVQKDLHLIYDCGSKNRTKKGKSFLKPTVRYELKHGDMVTLGDVKCQYLVGVDMDDEADDETGSETESESMLPVSTSGEEIANNNLGVKLLSQDDLKKSTDEKVGAQKDTLKQTQAFQVPKSNKDVKEAYAADTDSGTDDEQPRPATAAMATVLYSSEDEEAAPMRKPPSPKIKKDATVDGQTLAFGLGSPDFVFHSRNLTGSGQTASVPPTLMLSPDSDEHIHMESETPVYPSHSSPRHTDAVGSGMQPTCDPTLLCASESDDGSPRKMPPHLGARDIDNLPSCGPTLLYGSESEEGSPQKKARTCQGSNQPTLLYESDSEKGDNGGSGDEEKKVISEPTLLYSLESNEGTKRSIPEKREPSSVVDISTCVAESPIPRNREEEHSAIDAEEASLEIKDAAPLLHGADEISSTDDESEPDGEAVQEGTDLDETRDYAKATLAYDRGEFEKEEAEDGFDGIAYRDDVDLATQPYSTDSDNKQESEPILPGSKETKDRSETLQPTVAFDLEATQAYLAEHDDNSDSSDSQPLPLCRSSADVQDGNLATLAYGLEETQAYSSAIDDSEDGEDKYKERKHSGMEPTLAYDLPATQAYGAARLDDDDGDDTRDSDIQATKQEEPDSKTKQEKVAYGLEATLAYGANDDHDDNDNVDDNSSGKRKKHKDSETDKPTRVYSLAATLPYRVDSNDNNSSDNDNHDELRSSSNNEPKNQVASADDVDFVAETQDLDVGEEGSASRVIEGDIEATQAYGIEEAYMESKGNKCEVGTLQDKENNEIKEEETKETVKAQRGRKKGSLKRTAVAVKVKEDDVHEILTTRRGKKGPMRVTFEPDQEEDATEELPPATPRGQKRKTNKATKCVEEAESAKQTPNLGRRRRQQSSKLEEYKVEIKMGKCDPGSGVAGPSRGRRRQSKTLVLETPLKIDKPSGTDTAEEISLDDSNIAVAIAEKLNGCKRGRGRPKKAAAVKESEQSSDLNGMDVPGSSNQLPTETASSVKTPGEKRKGKGRGKRTMQSNTESEMSGSQTSVLSDIQPAQSPLLPSTLSGRGRGKGRGKKSQPQSQKIEVTEEPSQEQSVGSPSNNSQTRRQRGKGRPSRQSQEREENSDSTMTLPATPELSESVQDSEESIINELQSKGGHNSRQAKLKRNMSESQGQATPAKKSKHGKEPLVRQSPSSLHHGAAESETRPRVMFTGLVDTQGEKIVASLGGELVNSIHSCTHLVTDKVRRTVKFLCGLAGGQIIVQPSWLEACKKARSFVDSSPFLVKDKEAEKQYKFDLQRSHHMALEKGLLEGCKVYVTKRVKPEPAQMKDIIQSAKGEFLSSMPKHPEDGVFIISCEDDRNVCKKALEASIPIVSAEILLTGVLQQNLNLEEHRLFCEELTAGSQDSTSSTQSKRKRSSAAQRSETSSSTPETKGSKRRKR